MMKITIKDIAEKANVSVATVSRVVNNKSKGVGEDTRKRILELVEEYNYQPSAVARGLVTKKSKIIGLIIPDLTNPFYPKMAKGIEDEASKHGYNIILCDGNNSMDKEAAYLDFLGEHYVCGIIYNNFKNISDTILNKILKSSLPLVFIDSKPEIKGCKCVYLDNHKAMYDMIEYLIHNGHRRIGFMTGPLDSYSINERYKGYLKALEDNGIAIDSDLVVQGEYAIKDGYDAMERLLETGTDMTAVACCNDLMAIGAMEKIEELGMCVPEDISVVGFDNIEMTRLVRPKLTTVAQPIYDMGREAARMIINIIEGHGKHTQDNLVFEPSLVIRDSVKKIEK
ncbi:LacI family DNA-binding transcriptional regulator [Vallitalea pronyensis]|uniref:LacI family DNA-binding transcriptional regulator n=1 Tax=Vallitalea pronyensis TaxID=1348613 RepID=A0A8J8SI21_9FIRM|nr:LacI family DNA-binding transcriptional regulator [Vallitalea pronyensis]QUI24028.1 LacI family DNA-binding transcriptional regulator [Vallitalea pronyensis]